MWFQSSPNVLWGLVMSQTASTVNPGWCNSRTQRWVTGDNASPWTGGGFGPAWWGGSEQFLLYHAGIWGETWAEKQRIPNWIQNKEIIYGWTNVRLLYFSQVFIWEIFKPTESWKYSVVKLSSSLLQFYSVCLNLPFLSLSQWDIFGKSIEN